MSVAAPQQRNIQNNPQTAPQPTRKQPDANRQSTQRQNEVNYLQQPAQVSGSYNPAGSVQQKRASPPKGHFSNCPWHYQQDKVPKNTKVADSLDLQIEAVDSGFFASQKMPQQPQQQQAPVQAQPQRQEPPVPQQEAEKLDPNAKYQRKIVYTQSESRNEKSQALRASNVVDPNIDDSEFYYNQQEMFNTQPRKEVVGEKVIEKNLRGVMERHFEIHKDHKPCKVPNQLYEQMPMSKEGIYKKDFKPQDLSLAKPQYGEANNPYDCFMPQKQPEDINSIYRKDYVGKKQAPGSEPDIRDVISSQQDYCKNLRAPKTNDTLYKADYPNWGVVPPPSKILPANPATLGKGMPFASKTTTMDYGNFMGMKDTPIKTYNRLQKSR